METKKLKKISLLLYVVSWLLCFGLFVIFVNVGVNRYMTNDGSTMVEFEERFGSLATEYVNKLKTITITALVGLIPMAVLSILVKDKFKPTIWMLNIILSNILVDSWAMYVVFVLWLIDNYVLLPLAKKYQLRYQINKEIDARG